MRDYIDDWFDSSLAEWIKVNEIVDANGNIDKNNKYLGRFDVKTELLLNKRCFREFKKVMKKRMAAIPVRKIKAKNNKTFFVIGVK